MHKSVLGKSAGTTYGKGEKMSNKLCLYCGSTESIPAKHETRHAVMCLMCKAMGPNKPTEQEAIAAWNQRVVSLDEIERLRTLVQDAYYEGGNDAHAHMVWDNSNACKALKE